jgi:hypothetical protein
VNWRRRAAEDVTVGEEDIPKDATVLLPLSSANRDPDKFDEAERFDITRKDARKHLTFGKGIHFCQGAPLARMEVRVVLELLREMAPNLRIVPDQKFRFTRNVVMPGPRSWWVDFASAQTGLGR